MSKKAVVFKVIGYRVFHIYPSHTNSSKWRTVIRSTCWLFWVPYLLYNGSWEFVDDATCKTRTTVNNYDCSITQLRNTVGKDFKGSN